MLHRNAPLSGHLRRPEPVRHHPTDNNRRLGFGTGTYYCLGAALARVQVDECLRTALTHLPNLRPADDEQPELTAGRQFGHHSRLPVRF